MGENKMKSKQGRENLCISSADSRRSGVLHSIFYERLLLIDQMGWDR